MDPPTSIYTPLNTARREIRLLEILPGIEDDPVRATIVFGSIPKLFGINSHRRVRRIYCNLSNMRQRPEVVMEKLRDFPRLDDKLRDACIATQGNPDEEPRFLKTGNDDYPPKR